MPSREVPDISHSDHQVALAGSEHGRVQVWQAREDRLVVLKNACKGKAVGADTTLVIYDGECVFCNNYVRFVRLRETIGKVDLLDARSDDPRVERYWKEGFDLNEGLLFVYNGKTYQGAEAVRILSGLSTGISVLNRLNRAVFSSRVASQALYPFLKIGRRLTLLARGSSMLTPS